MTEAMAQRSPAETSLGKTTLSEDRARHFVRASFDVGDAFLNRGGQVFCGFVAAMLESLCGHAVMLAQEHIDQPRVALEMKVAFLASTKTGRLIGEGWIVKSGRSIAFAESELRDGAGTLFAKASATFKAALQPHQDHRGKSE